MKVLFLDFDGVLNQYPNTIHNHLFNRQAIMNLEMLLNKVSDLKIVISSAHRREGLDVMKETMSKNGIDPRRVIDVTGDEQSSDEKDHRGYQVECWLAKHPEVKQFVILDDKADFVPLKHKLVKTNGYIGLTKDNVEKALKILDE